MTKEFWLSLIIGFLVFEFIFNKVLSYLNSKTWKNEIPDEMKEFISEENYLKAKAYRKENGKLDLISSVFSLVLMLFVLLGGIFGKLDAYLLQFEFNIFLHTALFFVILVVVSDILSFPFSWYHTFVIEEKYGFNKTSKKTFFIDKIKGYLLAGTIGGVLLWITLYLFELFPEGYWIYLWAVVVIFMFLLNMFYADFILPLFNKLQPLPEGELKDEIKNYTDKIGYSIKNIYVIDGSKRSTKANAFFSGMGPRKTIALYDTLIEKQTIPELIAILAHEVGHYKKKHTQLSLIVSVFQIGVMLFLLEYFLKIPEISQAMGGNGISFHLGIIAFGLLFSPISLLLGVFMNILSRKNEFEADAYAKETYQSEPLITGLKKLSADTFSNLYPHPFFVFVHYSHPPLLERIKALRK